MEAKQIGLQCPDPPETWKLTRCVFHTFSCSGRWGVCVETWQTLVKGQWELKEICKWKQKGRRSSQSYLVFIMLLIKLPKFPLDNLTKVSYLVKILMNQSAIVCFNLEMIILMVMVLPVIIDLIAPYLSMHSFFHIPKAPFYKAPSNMLIFLQPLRWVSSCPCN